MPDSKGGSRNFEGGLHLEGGISIETGPHLAKSWGKGNLKSQHLPKLSGEWKMCTRCEVARRQMM